MPWREDRDEAFPVLRKMKPAIQIATVELMLLRNDCSVSFAKTSIALTPPDLLTVPSPGKRQLKAASVMAQMILEEDTEHLVRNLKAVEESYGTDVLTLTVSCTYVEELLGHAKVVRYLERHHSGVLGTLQNLLFEIRAPRKGRNSE
jgi:hypothetical protein